MKPSRGKDTVFFLVSGRTTPARSFIRAAWDSSRARFTGRRCGEGAGIFTIRNALIRHFGGVTVLHQPPAPAFGVGARDPSNVGNTLEQNEHIAFEVYAAPVQDSDDYFRALRNELEEALQEGVHLIERQQATLI